MAGDAIQTSGNLQGNLLNLTGGVGVSSVVFDYSNATPGRNTYLFSQLPSGVDGADIYLPAVDGYLAYSVAGTYAPIDNFINQSVKTTASPTFHNTLTIADVTPATYSELVLEFDGLFAEFIYDGSILTIGSEGSVNFDNPVTMDSTLGAGAITGTTLTATAAGGLTLGTDAATNIAGKIKLWSAGANAFSTTFTAGEQTADCAYTLPTAVGAAGAILSHAAADGVLQWLTVLPVANGGTGLATLTAGYIPYGAGTSAFASSANLTFVDNATPALAALYCAGKGQFGGTLSTNTKLGVRLTSAAPFNGTGLVEIVTDATYPLVNNVALLVDSVKSVSGTSLATNTAGQFFALGPSIFTATRTTSPQIYGLYGGCLPQIDTAGYFCSGVITAAGLYFRFYNDSDFTGHASNHERFIHYGLLVDNSSGYLNRTISGKVREQGLGGSIISYLAGTHSQSNSSSGTNYAGTTFAANTEYHCGLFVSTVDNLAAAPGTVAIQNVTLHLKTAASTNLNGGLSWALYSESDVPSAFLGKVAIGKITAPTVALDVTGAGLFSLTLDVAGAINSTSAQTTVNGLTGTAVWSMPFQGTSYKKFLVYLTGFTSAGTVITFPTAFSVAPVVYGDAAAVAIAVTTTTTTTLTSVGAVAGFIIIEGW